MYGTNDPFGLNRTRAGREGSVGQRGLQVNLPVDPVARSSTRRRRQDTVAFEIADLLNGVPSASRDIDCAHGRRLESCHPSLPCLPMSSGSF